jgi:hypothetical protein
MDGGDATTLKKGGPGIIYFRRHRVVSWMGELEVSVSGIHTPLGLKCLSFSKHCCFTSGNESLHRDIGSRLVGPPAVNARPVDDELTRANSPQISRL